MGQINVYVEGRSCWTCLYWKGHTTPGGTHAVCQQDPDQVLVIALSDVGCAYWQHDPLNANAHYAVRAALRAGR